MQESNSEIIYDDYGQPSEVIVYVEDERGDSPLVGMRTSESRPFRTNRQRPRGFGRRRPLQAQGQHHPIVAQRRRFQGHHHPAAGRGKANFMRPAGSTSFHNLPDADGYYDEHMEYDDDNGPYGVVSRGDHDAGGLEYVGGGGGDDYSPLRRSYDHGHDDHGGGYDDHHGGYGHDHHGGGYHDDHDHGYSPVKKPGPFGYGKPNYKCEYAKETLYVSKTTYKFKKKCYKILKVKCSSKYGKGKKIGYKKICNEFSITKCRTIYATKFKTKCWLVYKKKCEDFYKTKIDWVYKEKCSMVYEKECHGYGYHKSCHEVPKEICKQVL